MRRGADVPGLVCLKGESGRWYLEIATEMTESDIKKIPAECRRPSAQFAQARNAAKAREALLGIIERATEHLTI